MRLPQWKKQNDKPEKIMGYPDDLKLRSSMTLFADAAPDETVFQAVLDKYFEGKKDQRTLDILKGHSKIKRIKETSERKHRCQLL